MSFAVAPSEIVSMAGNRLGRPLLVFDTALEVLQANLCPYLAELNRLAVLANRPELFPVGRKKNGLVNAFPQAFRFYGEDMGALDDTRNWPQVLVGGAVSTEEFGLGHEDTISLNVSCVFPPQINRRQFQLAVDVATAIRDILRHPRFAGMCVHPDTGLIAWGKLWPIGFMAIPPDHARYSGYMARFVVKQYPGSNNIKYV